MRWDDARAVVETLRQTTQLYLPALTTRRGFSSSRVEHLVHGLAARVPAEECYLEVGTLEGRTLEAAAVGNPGTRIIGCDPGQKYASTPPTFPPWVTFMAQPWQEVLPTLVHPVGVAFYDGDHGSAATAAFLRAIVPHLASTAVVVLDDWDRRSVRMGTYTVAEADSRWRLLHEMPAYTDGLTAPPDHFGYYFGVALWGFGA